MDYKAFVTPRNAIIAAVALAVIGFLAIDYVPPAGILANIMWGEITVDGCRRFFGTGTGGLDVRDPACIWSLPYRWVLVCSVVMIAGALIVQRRGQ